MAKAKFKDIFVVLLKDELTVKSGTDLIKLLQAYDKLNCDTIVFQWVGDRRHTPKEYIARLSKLLADYLPENSRLRFGNDRPYKIRLLPDTQTGVYRAYVSEPDGLSGLPTTFAMAV